MRRALIRDGGDFLNPAGLGGDSIARREVDDFSGGGNGEGRGELERIAGFQWMKFETVQRPSRQQDDGQERGEQRAALLPELLHRDHAERGAVALHRARVLPRFCGAEELLELRFVLAASLEQSLIGCPSAHQREDERGANRDDEQLHVGRKAQQPAEQEIHECDDEVVELRKHVRRDRAV